MWAKVNSGFRDLRWIKIKDNDVKYDYNLLENIVLEAIDAIPNVDPLYLKKSYMPTTIKLLILSNWISTPFAPSNPLSEDSCT